MPLSAFDDVPSAPTLSRRDLLRLGGVGGLGLLAPLLTAPVLSAASLARPFRYRDTIADARATIAGALAEGPATAVTVALVDRRGILWAEAFGWLDRAQGLKPNPDTLFGLASGSKMLAAVTAMLLADRGLVELDAPLVRYLPEFRMAEGEDYDAITVRMLLNHSSGLPGSDYRNGETVIPVAGYAAQVLETLSTQYLKHAPGTRAMYCNDGFSLIELLVAAVTGQSYTDFVALELLLPLGMTQSRFPLYPLAPGSFAPGLDAEGRPLPQTYANPYGTGGFYTTPTDIGRLAMMLLNGGRLPDGRRLLSAAAVAEMGRCQTDGLPLNEYITSFDGQGFGLGWDGVREGGLAAVGVTAWHKSGDTAYYHTQFIVAPDERLAVMVMDVSGNIAGSLAERILLHALAERGSIDGVPQPLVPDPGPVVPATDADLAAMVGCYAENGKIWRLDARPDRSLTLSLFSNSAWQSIIEGLRLRPDGRFVADSDPSFAYRGLSTEGHRYLLERSPLRLGHYEHENLRAEELPPGAPLSAPWQARLGRRWLLVNDPYSLYLTRNQQSVLLALAQAPGLDGYLIVNPRGMTYAVDPRIGDDCAGMCLGYTRDVNDLVVEQRDGAEWLRWGSYLHRPLETVPSLAAEQERIVIGDAGLGEWRRVPADAILTINGACIWYRYDAAFALLDWSLEDGVIAAAAAETWLFVHGEAGQVIAVRAGADIATPGSP